MPVWAHFMFCACVRTRVTTKDEIRRVTSQEPELGAAGVADRVGTSTSYVYEVWREDRDDGTDADTGGSDLEIDTDNETATNNDLETEDLIMSDDDDAKDYECNNCGHPLDYLGGEDTEEGKRCPECNHGLAWSKVE